MPSPANFSATAELTANFDEKADGTAADSTNPGSVSGRIKDFELSSNRSVTWLLVLDAQDATASNGGGATGIAISTTGGGAGGTSWTAGAWGFELVGNDPNFGNLNAEGMAGAYPTGIIGTFGARTGTTTASDGDDPQPLYLATGAVNPTDVGFVSVVGAFGVRLQDD